jgi:hypothetical protein
VLEISLPPYSAGVVGPRMPSSPICVISSRGSVSPSHQPCTLGMMSVSTKARTVAWMSRSSSVRPSSALK